MLVSWARFLHVFYTDPAYIALGPERLRKPQAGQTFGAYRNEKTWPAAKEKKRAGMHPGATPVDGELIGAEYDAGSTSSTWADPRDDADVPGFEDFCAREAYVAEEDGRPKFCAYCANWKTDRAHHCRELGRCVARMDHFCPWAGGVVAETTYKFFVQFVSYAALYCTVVVAVTAAYVKEVRDQHRDQAIAQWAVALGLGAFFGLFSLGIAATSIQAVLENFTTMENFNRKTRVQRLAVHVPHDPSTTAGLRTVTYGGRSFAILMTDPGENVWDAGYYVNWCAVMGRSPVDWILPLRRSPLCGKEEFGPLLRRLHERHGIA